MTVKGLWALLKVPESGNSDGAASPSAVSAVRGGEELSRVLDGQILVVDLSRWIMEAILVHERSLRGGPPQHLLPKNASTTANGFEDSPAFNISSRSSTSCSTSSSHQHAFVILTAFRKLVRLFLLGVQTVVGVLDSQRLPPDKNKSKGRQEQYRFGPALYKQFHALFAAFDLLVIESAHEGEALCAAVQDRLFRQFGLRSVVDSEDGDALLYGSWRLLKKLRPFEKPCSESDLASRAAGWLVQLEALEPEGWKGGGGAAPLPARSLPKQQEGMLLGEAPAGGNADRSVAARVLGASCSSSSTSDGSSLLARLQAQRAKNQQTSCTPFLKKRKVDYFADVSTPSFAGLATAAADTNSTAPAPLPPTPSSSSKKARRKQSAAVTLNRFELAFVAALSGSDFEETGASGLGPARAVEVILELRSNVSLAAARAKQKEIKRSNKKRTRSDLVDEAEAGPVPDESLAGVKELLQSSAGAAEYRKSVYDKDCAGVLRGYLREKHPARLVEVFDRYVREADSYDWTSCSAPNQKTAEAVGRQLQARGPEFFDFDVQKLLNLLPQSHEKTKMALRPLFAERYFRRALLSKGAVVVGGTTLDARPGETGEDLHSKARSEGPAPPPAAALQGDRILTATALMASQLQQGGGAGCRGGRSSAPSATSSSTIFSPGREQSKDFRVRDRLSEERYEPFSLRAPVFPLQLRKKQEDGEHWRCVVDFGSDGWVEVRKSLLERFDPSLKDTLAALHEKEGGGVKSMTHARSRTATTPGATKSEAKRRTPGVSREPATATRQLSLDRFGVSAGHGRLRTAAGAASSGVGEGTPMKPIDGVKIEKTMLTPKRLSFEGAGHEPGQPPEGKTEQKSNAPGEIEKDVIDLVSSSSED